MAPITRLTSGRPVQASGASATTGEIVPGPVWTGSWRRRCDTQRLAAKVTRHVGLQMPGRQQRFGDAPELGHVSAGIDGSGLGFSSELAAEIAIQHGFFDTVKKR